MRRAAVYAAIIVATFAAVHFIEVQERHHSEHETCLTEREGRKQGNIRAHHLYLIEQALIDSNLKAQKEIKGYHYPKEVNELKEGGKVEALPVPRC
jgi:hypothetical protein